jgi:type 1 glutamine amidotransferase
MQLRRVMVRMGRLSRRFGLPAVKVRLACMPVASRRAVAFGLLGAPSALAAAAPAPLAPPFRPRPKDGAASKVLVVTGGHDHDPEFYAAFDHPLLRAKVDPHPNGLEHDVRGRADVLVLYDTVRDLDPRRQKTLRDFIESGRGLVVIHHGICTGVRWPWWYEEVVGGRWLFEPTDGKPATTYKHDQDIAVRPAGDHPITRGLRPFRIWDETYKGLWISPRVKPLLETDHPDSDRTIAWVGPAEKARVVYVQLGHDRNANLNPAWQRLVQNAVRWAGGRLA